MKIPNELNKAFRAVRGDSVVADFDEAYLRPISAKIIEQEIGERQRRLADLQERLDFIGAAALAAKGATIVSGVSPVRRIELNSWIVPSDVMQDLFSKAGTQKVVAGGKKLPSQPSVKP